MTNQENIERPAALSVGILLSAATSALALFCIFGGATFLGIFGGVAMVEEGVEPLGLGIVYHGMESGDGDVLQRIDKGGTRVEAIETAAKDIAGYEVLLM